MEKEIISSKENTNSNDKSLNNSIFSVFIFNKNYSATAILIYLNLLIFIVMLFSGVNFLKPIDLINWGGTCGICINKSEWWRLISSCFIHFGPIHLIVNSLTLIYAGYLIEPGLKKWKILFTYVLSGIIANVGGLFWNKNVLYVGADGAVFGLYGLLLAMYLLNILKFRINLKLAINIAIVIIINILYDFLDHVPETLHIFGFTAGITLGLIIFLSKKLQKS